MQLINKSKRIFTVNTPKGVVKVAPTEIVEVDNEEGKRLVNLCSGELVELKAVTPEPKEEEKKETPKKKIKE